MTTSYGVCHPNLLYADTLVKEKKTRQLLHRGRRMLPRHLKKMKAGKAAWTPPSAPRYPRPLLAHLSSCMPCVAVLACVMGRLAWFPNRVISVITYSGQEEAGGRSEMHSSLTASPPMNGHLTSYTASVQTPVTSCTWGPPSHPKPVVFGSAVCSPGGDS